jgi:hypothetical protein
MRCGSPELARRAVDQLATTTAASGTHWAAGLEALCRALTTGDDDAERLFLESIDHLKQTRVVTSLARVTLLYGEWLRRQGRRIDARRQLRAAKLGITSRNQLSRALQQTGVSSLLVGDPVAVEAERDAGGQVESIG